MVDRYVDVARKAAEKVTGTGYCQYGMHQAPVDRLVVWKGARGPAKRICLSCEERRNGR